MDPPLSFSLLKPTSPNSTTSAAAAAITITGYPNYPDSTATATAENPDHSVSYQEKLVTCFFIVAFMLYFSLGLAFVSIFTHPLPNSPTIELVSTSVAVHNVSDNDVTGDLDVCFHVSNINQTGMMFKDLSLLASYDDNLSSLAATIAPLEQDRIRQSTVWFSLKDMRVPVSDAVESEVTWNIPVRFELRARVRYEGISWTKKEISIKADCGERELGFPLNNVNATRTTIMSSKLQARDCRVHRGWSKIDLLVLLGSHLGILILLLLSFRIIAELFCCCDPSLRLIFSRQSKSIFGHK